MTHNFSPFLLYALFLSYILFSPVLVFEDVHFSRNVFFYFFSENKIKFCIKIFICFYKLFNWIIYSEGASLKYILNMFYLITVCMVFMICYINGIYINKRMNIPPWRKFIKHINIYTISIYDLNVAHSLVNVNYDSYTSLTLKLVWFNWRYNLTLLYY